MKPGTQDRLPSLPLDGNGEVNEYCMSAAWPDQSGLAYLLRSLDDKSRAILWYLWWHRHAQISELRDLFDTADDFDVLHRLKGVINGKSQELWGKPIVCFEQSKIDRLTGEKVLFSWWFMGGENAFTSGGDTTLVDMFDEKDSVVIIAQLPVSVELTRPDIQCRNGVLKVKFTKAGVLDKATWEGNERTGAPELDKE